MSIEPQRAIELVEFSPRQLNRAELSENLAELLWNLYSGQVAIEPPSFKNGWHWQLTALGWVGYIPLSPELGFRLMPKVPLGNLFRMLEYAYRLKSFHLLDSLICSESLEEFYERLAHILARRVLDRGRKGFYRSYLIEDEQLPYVRGRMDVERMICFPWEVKPRCRYDRHTTDIEENQILAWTLRRIARSGLCTERVLPTVRRAYRSVQGLVTLQPIAPDQCVGRPYNRLNEDYRPLHALCRLFLEQSGPSHQAGDRQMLPFLVNMARLFELFIVEWLRQNLPTHIVLKAQERVPIDRDRNLHFDIDLVLYDMERDAACYVLDTKYKVPTGAPAPEDVAQVVAYAQAKGCCDAVLLYPAPLSNPLDAFVGKIRVRSLAFSLAGDLQKAGNGLLEDLFFNSAGTFLTNREEAKATVLGGGTSQLSVGVIPKAGQDPIRFPEKARHGLFHLRRGRIS